jgi:hypothetical protein
MPPRKEYSAILGPILSEAGSTPITGYDNLLTTSQFTFKCKCGAVETKKVSLLIYKGIPCCYTCAKVEGKKKVVATSMERYGTPSPQQSKVVKDKTSATNLDRYGVTNPLQNAEVLEKIKKTNIEKYGADNPFKSEEIKQKIRNTNIQKYGVENPLKNPTIQAKLEATSMERYGTRRPSENIAIKTKIKETHGAKTADDIKTMLDKTKETSLQRYGTPSPNQAAVVKQHKVESSLQKYGTEYPMQNMEVQVKSQKNAFHRKEFTMPSGAIRIVQGYEPFALRDLLQSNFTENQIVTDREKIPRIEYAVKNKKRYYFPDIFIPHVNKIIEVKSTWTYKCKTDNITEKSEASKAAGYDYETWVYDGKGQRVHSVISATDSVISATDSSDSPSSITSSATGSQSYSSLSTIPAPSAASMNSVTK